MKKILLFFAAAVCAVASWAQTNELSATISGDKLTVSLNNETNYVAFQMDIALPDGVSVDPEGAIALNEERLDKNATVSVAGASNSDFIVAYNVISGNVLRVVSYNLQNRQIAKSEGELFTVTLKNYTEGTISIDNLKFVTKDALEEATLAAIEAEAAGEIDFDVDGNGSFGLSDISYLLNLYMTDGAYVLSKVDFDQNGSFGLGDVSTLLNVYLSK